MMEVNNTTKTKINSAKLKRVIEKFVALKRLRNFSVSVAIIGDAKMTELNYRYRGIKRPTDVLSFVDVNEIIINIKQIERQAKEQGQSREAELIFILVHGLLHLVGYNDDTEPKRLKMIALGEDFIRSL